MKYHVNKENGEVGVCSAKPGNCPLGADVEHYTNKYDARKAYENSQSGKYLGGVSVNKLNAAMNDPNSSKRNISGFKLPVSLGDPMSSYRAEVSERYTDSFGDVWEVTNVNTEPGWSTGDKNSGPIVVMSPLDKNGNVISGITRHVYHGAGDGSTPDDFKRVGNKATVESLKKLEENRKMDDFYSEPSIARNPGRLKSTWEPGKHQFQNAVVCTFSHSSSSDKESRYYNVEKQMIIPNVSRLTEKKKLVIGAKMWSMAQLPHDAWAEASIEEKIDFVDGHIAKHKKLEITVDENNKLSWSGDDGFGMGHNAADYSVWSPDKY